MTETPTLKFRIIGNPCSRYNLARLLYLKINTTGNYYSLMFLSLSFGEKKRASPRARQTGNSQITNQQRQLHKDFPLVGGSEIEFALRAIDDYLSYLRESRRKQIALKRWRVHTASSYGTVVITDIAFNHIGSSLPHSPFLFFKEYCRFATLPPSK